jgi:hypothetical protein
MVVNDKNVSNIKHMSHLQPSLVFSKMSSFTKNNVTQFRWGSLRILFWWLLKAICHCFLWIPLGWGEWCFVFVVKSNVPVNLFMNTFLLCYRKPWKFMCFLPLVNCNYETMFDLWMSMLSYDTFALIIQIQSFISQTWVPFHKIIELFKTSNAFTVAFA